MEDSARFFACYQVSIVGAEAIAVIILSLFCLSMGVALAGIASSRPIQQAMLEAAGGSLVNLGLGIVGVCLPLFR